MHPYCSHAKVQGDGHGSEVAYVLVKLLNGVDVEAPRVAGVEFEQACNPRVAAPHPLPALSVNHHNGTSVMEMSDARSTPGSTTYIMAG